MKKSKSHHCSSTLQRQLDPGPHPLCFLVNGGSNRYIVQSQTKIDGQSPFLLALATRLEACDQLTEVRIRIGCLLKVADRFVILELGMVIGADAVHLVERL